MRDLKQLIELAEMGERDPASRDHAIEIYELIINEHDYSHYSTTAAAALDRLEKNEAAPARVAKRERSQIEIILFRLAVITYVASLVLPADGQFFAGVMALVLSAIASMFLIPAMILQIPDNPEAVLGLITVLMPFYNVLFFIALTRFWEAGRTRFSIFRISLYTCTVASLVWASMALFTHFERFYLFGLWALAFLFLSLAVAICTEKNLTNAGKGRS